MGVSKVINKESLESPLQVKCFQHHVLLGQFVLKQILFYICFDNPSKSTQDIYKLGMTWNSQARVVLLDWLHALGAHHLPARLVPLHAEELRVANVLSLELLVHHGSHQDDGSHQEDGGDGENHCPSLHQHLPLLLLHLLLAQPLALLQP